MSVHIKKFNSLFLIRSVITRSMDDIIRKEEKEQELLDAAFRSMGCILNKEDTPLPVGGGSLLLKACRLIGSYIDETFIEPPEIRATTPSERVYEIAAASGVNYRNVELPAKWWREDHGILLGFMSSEPFKPLVFVPSAPGSYDAIDPTDGTRHTIDDAYATGIEPNGYMFYRSFPQKDKVSGADVAQFCLKGRRKDIWTIIFFGVLGAFISLFIPFAYQVIFDEVIPYLDKTLFTHVMIGLAIIFLSSAIFTLTIEYTILRFESFLHHDVEAALWDRLLNLSINFFRRFTVGNLMQRINAAGEIRRLVSGPVLRAMIGGAFSFVYLIAIFYYSPTLAVAGFALLAIGILVTILGFYIVRKKEAVLQDLRGRLNGKIVEMMFGLSKIRTNGVENRIFASWAKDHAQIEALDLQIGKTNTAVTVVNAAIQPLKLLVIFVLVMSLMKADLKEGRVFDMSIGAFLAFTAAFVAFAAALLRFSSALMETAAVHPLWSRAKAILEEPPEKNTGRARPVALKGDIRIDQIYFRYDKNSPLVHSGVSLHAAPGEFIGIVGPSGCGKSTLVRLLLGFEIAEQGAIYFDDKDLAHLDLRALRCRMGVILQDSAILDGTIRENIVCGNIASDKEVMDAVRFAGFENELKHLPQGLDTPLGAGGTILSGGQRQRVFIARSMLTLKPIIIWDEATNALDNASQMAVTKNLEKVDATRIVIAHRLSTLRHADRIYVMDKGKIIDVGTFEELSARPGIFSSLLKQQKSF